jgi:hypothetical protein
LTAARIEEAKMSDPIAWIPLILWTLLFAAPLVKLLDRTGKPIWWIIVAMFPIVGGLVLLYVVAFSTWPKIPEPMTPVS